MPEPSLAAESRTVLEAGVPLSDSLLWTFQRRYFAGRGIDAWRRREVPHYITCNAFVARAYARIIQAFRRDRARVDPEEPLLILELGAGSGRLGYAICRELLDLDEREPGTAAPWCYVLSDFSEATLSSWREQPALQRLLAAGCLELAACDLAREAGELLLEPSGRRVRPGEQALVVVANYVFDGLPQDLYWLDEEEGFQQVFVTLEIEGTEPDLEDPLLLSALEIGLSYQAVPADPLLDSARAALLDQTRARVGSGAFALSWAGLACLRRFRALAPEAALFLVADRGSFAAQAEPDLTASLALHGSFSLPVDFRALAAQVEALGGAVLQPGEVPEKLCAAGFLFAPPDSCSETRRTYAAIDAGCGPDAFYQLKRAWQRRLEEMTSGELLAGLRLSNWDPGFLGLCAPVLCERAPQLSAGQRAALCRGIERAWSRYLPLGEDPDLPFALGLLFYALEEPARALRLYACSRDLYGADPQRAFNVALCHCLLGEPRAALECVEQALAGLPEHEGVRSLHAQLREELGEGDG